MARDETASASHTSTVRQIVEAAEKTWQALLQLQASSKVNPNGVFVEEDSYRQSMHPQKKAHSYLLGYHQLIANKTYTVRAQDLWEEPLKHKTGHVYTAEVPANTVVELDGRELELANIETRSEAISLETLHYHWGMRHISVKRVKGDSWEDEELKMEQERVWLPPKAIELAYERLEDVRAKIDLGAELGKPDWHADKVLDPTDGLREPYEDQE